MPILDGFYHHHLHGDLNKSRLFFYEVDFDLFLFENSNLKQLEVEINQIELKSRKLDNYSNRIYIWRTIRLSMKANH